MSELAPRSYLFVPGNRPDRFAKAAASGVDVVVIDLEDAVPPAEKKVARAALAEWLASGDTPVAVRINDVNSEWFREDIALCRAPSVKTVMLPKTERIDDIFLCEFAGKPTDVLPMIETAQGFRNVVAIAQHRLTTRLVFGNIDFQLDLSIDGDDEQLLYFRSHIVLASRLGNLLPPVDGVSLALDDPAQIERDTHRAKRLGFGAKLCIHPKQVHAVNAAFLPTEKEIEWARKVVDTAAASHGAAVAVDGRMVDRPVILKAQEILAESQRRAVAAS
ncbi:HpcH/HpaI aldolase/citrate lyase family protein [Burkholderia lata]|uniref:HpcH/HpaI aldolase n=1 Tax=Burkholderia lata (strain ATCC 17760 / DSM 23089 / LMG 22485 / NCIMB 9086 / R18194 / 383) TaxID=482957 RepID=A0A6P2YH21_BURL3|nr:CoA ester lyase [Burkholderia lata]VWD21291.1 HpcH/HpaI aldolase [Burkholderia lata]